MIRNTIFLLLICFFVKVSGQEKGFRNKTVLDSLATSSVPQLNNMIDISFSNIAIKELVRTIANTTGVNVTIDPNVNVLVNSNFNKVSATDVISYLCTQYNLEIIIRGSILHLQPIVVKEEKLSIEQLNDSTINFESNKIKVSNFFRELTNKSGSNFILSPDIGDKFIRGYAKNISLKNALLQISAENNH